jgi:STAS-like domain of unknown function (DUF4325)
MIQIRVLDVIGPICVDPEDGTVLCALTRDALSQGSAVKLDFEGVRTLTGSFLNSAVGCLRATFSAEVVRDNLFWDGLDVEDQALLRLVLNNANRFYNANQDGRDALTSASLSAIED